MSRLFSRLETLGQEPNEGTAPAAAAGTDHHADTHGGMTVPAAAPAPVGTVAPALPLVLGYAISPDLPMPPPGATLARPVWPVWLWLLSLIGLIVLSLAVLVMPERLLLRPASHQSQPTVPATDTAVSAPPAAAVVTQERPLARAASTGATVPGAAAPTAPAPAPAPAPAARNPAAAAPPATENAGCSQAMRAMNLCSTTSP